MVGICLMNDSYVKLIPNSTVKELLKEAQTTNRDIEVSAADQFFVRDKKTKNIVFKGMRLREDLWGLTFMKAYFPDSK
jgi:hypothetical protein